MKTRKQKHYGSEDEILHAINKARANVKKLRAKAQSVRLTPEQFDALNAAVRRYEESTIPNLITTLAAFNTMLLPGITDDKSVVLQRR